MPAVLKGVRPSISAGTRRAIWRPCCRATTVRTRDASTLREPDTESTRWQIHQSVNTSPVSFRPVMDRNRCEGKADCVRVCPTGVFTVGASRLVQKKPSSSVGWGKDQEACAAGRAGIITGSEPRRDRLSAFHESRLVHASRSTWRSHAGGRTTHVSCRRR